MQGQVNYDALEEALRDSDEAVRLNAVKRIISVPLFEEGEVPRFLKALLDRLKDPSVAVRYYGKKAFARLKRMVRNRDLAIIDPALLEESGTEMARPAPTFVYGTREYWLFELGSIDYKIRIKAIIELSKNPDDEEAHRRLSELLEKETHDHVIATLVKYIAYFHTSDAFFQLKGYLNHPDNRVRANLIEGFQILGDPRAVPLVRPCLRDPDNRVRANAAAFMVMFHPEEVLRSLGEMIRSGSDWMKDSALSLLSRVEVPQGETLLIEALDDGSMEFVKKAVQALGFNGHGPVALQALESIREGRELDSDAAREWPEEIREEAARAAEMLAKRLETRKSSAPKG